MPLFKLSIRRLARVGLGIAVIFVAGEVVWAEGESMAPLPGGLTTEPTSPPRFTVAKGGGPTFEAQVVELVNQERLTNGGLAPLKQVTLLDNSSETHSSNMATRNFFAHCDLDTGTTHSQRMVNAGYLASAGSPRENIAAGYSTPTSVMTAWMMSTEHRMNILASNIREIGVGYFPQPADQGNVREDLSPSTGDCVADSFNHGPFFHYWTQNFGRRDLVYPVVIDREAYSTDSAIVDLYIYGTGAATEMRIRNAPSGTFTEWLPFQTNYTWVLMGAAGTKTVEVELRNGGTFLGGQSDSIVLTMSADEIFSDGFESGDTTAWSSTVP